jgi:hypothetical protein
MTKLNTCSSDIKQPPSTESSRSDIELILFSLFLCNLYLCGQLVRFELKVALQCDWGFMKIIMLYWLNGVIFEFIYRTINNNFAVKINDSGVCYNERSYFERMLQRTVFINKIRMLQRTQILQRTQRNTIGRRNTHVGMTHRTLPLWLERQSSSLLSFVRFSYQFSSVICASSRESIF